MPIPPRPFLCRTNLRHHWEVVQPPDGDEYTRCSTCHREREERTGGKLQPWTVA
jgi:hypothetical protein